MSNDAKSETTEFLAHLEEMGEAQVRLLMSTEGFPFTSRPIILKWLADKAQESERLRTATAEEQIEIARSANEAAWTAARAAERASSAAERQAVAAERANTRATIALAIAIISIIATIIGIWIVHRDTMKAISHLIYFSDVLA